ncbi:hypothetical protein NUU61_003419 [Penicillium alfredii]|uniref:NmrA-like domain-containing protein n=1 Tax=Penicillium alfredii TaxID=1506179 RepID=A0A9W9FUR1_9EURO|nr:uncharacterized protein NUU61_003419 [Penicillium alfredii]KAJ5106072.1 hypothetical protein NUU61_003419 [Penicillium alfredii]
MRVAIAGGSSPTLGASIVCALLATHGRYVPIVLSREIDGRSSNELGPAYENVETRHVDYHSHESLVAALRDVDVVLSVLLVPGPEWVTTQVNLLRAAEVAGCRRFAPSEFALTSWAQTRVDILEAKNEVWRAVQASVDKGHIDAARFPCGMFMNYLGIGCPDESKRAEALAGFQEGPFLIHLDDHDSPWVEVPVRSDGTFPELTMTDIRDVGQFIVAALDLEEPWAGRDLGMAGDTLSFETLIALCQRHVERTIDIRRLTEQELQARLTSMPSHEFIARMECQLSLACAQDGSVVSPTLNQLCPVQPTTVEQYLELFWGSGPGKS